MSRFGWLYLQAHEKASNISSALLFKIIAIFVLCCSTCQAISSPVTGNNVHNYGDNKQPKSENALNQLIHKKLHSHLNGAGRVISYDSASNQRVIPTPSASALSPSQPKVIREDVHHDFALDPSFVGSLVRPRSIHDWTVTDLILISSIDGSLHAFDRQTGLDIWSIPGEQPLIQVSTSESLKNASNSGSFPSSCEDCDLIWITEPLGEGTLYYFTPNKGLQQLPISIKELVQSPFAFGKDQKLITGSHHTTLYSIESNTGKILKVYGAEKSTLSHSLCPTQSNPFSIEREEYDDIDKDANDFIEENGSFMIGRTDYKLQIHDKNEVIWNVTYSTWGPNKVDSDLMAQHVKSPDNLYVTPLHDSSILAWSTDGGKKPARWVGHTSSVAVKVFDVFRPSTSASDLSLMILPHPSYLQSTDNNDHLLTSAFIQRTSNEQWFAMSGKNFPALVLNAPRAQWVGSHASGSVYKTKDELWESLIGVHQNLGNASPFPKSHGIPNVPLIGNGNNGLLGIEGPNGGKLSELTNPYPYNNQVHRSPSDISRSSPPNPLPPTPPQPNLYSPSPTSRILNSALRILENALAFFIFFVFLLVAARYGWLPQLAGFLEFAEKLQSTTKVEPGDQKAIVAKTSDPSDDLNSDDNFKGLLNGTVTPQLLVTDSDEISAITPITPNTPDLTGDHISTNDSTPNPSSKNVVIIEPEQKLSVPVEETPVSPGVAKRRKRGSRGGKKNNARKKEKDEAQSDSIEVDPSLQGEPLTQVVHDANIKVVSKGVSPGSSDVNLVNNSNPTQMSLLDVSKEVIGYGSHGTVVLKGIFENREVAVKRMLLDFYEVASQEVSLLQESDDHPNVIRYYCKQASDRFLYIALELCPGTLEDLIEKPFKFRDLSNLLTPTQVLYQIASGVHHLHCLKIVHRDIKPQNILVAPPKVLHKKDVLKKQSQEVLGPVRMLISDFGLCKKLEGDQSSFRATTAHAAGTSGWRAPELLIDEQDSTYNTTVVSPSDVVGSSSEPLVIDSLSNRRATRAIDIFSMGCVFYYILSNGQHPFGDKYLREANIVQGSYSLEYLEDYQQPDMVEAHDLIERMISRDPKQRPDANEVLLHPFFWSPERRLDFLLKVSDRFEVEPRDPPSDLLNLLEEDAANVVGEDWHSKLDRGFVDNLGKYRKYHGDRIMDLLRAMRNKSHHFNDLPPTVRAAMEPYPEGYLAYFTKRFPFLLMTIYYVVKADLADEPMFKTFFFDE